MGQISPDYASPNLRLGLLLHDHPNASYKFEVVTGTDIGIPASWGGGGSFCVATISFGDGRSDAKAWKPIPKGGDAETLNTLQTKTLGRALKKAGYPDDLKELKALVLWRQRGAEIEAISSGTQQLAIAPTTRPAAALPRGDAPDELEAALSDAAVDDSDDSEIVDVDRLDTVKELVAGLDDRTLSNFDAYLASIGAPSDPDEMTDAELADALIWLDPDVE